MRITYIHQYFTTPSMSGGTRSYELARRLVLRGHEVTMITSDQSGGNDIPNRPSDVEGIRVRWIPTKYSNNMPFGERLRAFAKFAAAASIEARRTHPDVVFATSTPLTIGIPGIAGSLGRAPMVFEVRDLWPEMPIAAGALKNKSAIALARVMEKTIYSASTHIVALSPGMRDGVIAAGISPSKISVIPNLCEMIRFNTPPEAGEAFRRKHHWLKQRPLVTYVGTLGQLNGVDYLARLAAEASRLDPEVRFLVVGAGKMEDFVRSEAVRLGVLDKSFFMLPAIPKHEVPALLSAATISTSLFVDIPEMQANSANKFFDGLAAGRPVAINYGGWQRELIEEEKLGLYLSAHDLKTAAHDLVNRLHTPGWLEQAGLSARRYGGAHFSADSAALKLEAVLSKAASGARDNSQ